ARPMKQKYSGRATSRAPPAAARAISCPALARFSSTLGVETIWTAATLKPASAELRIAVSEVFSIICAQRRGDLPEPAPKGPRLMWQEYKIKHFQAPRRPCRSL